MSRTKPAEAWEGLRDVVQAAFGAAERVGAMERFGGVKPVADDSEKVLVRNREGRPIGVLIVSNPAAPSLVARAVDNAAQAKAALPAELGAAILDTLASGDFQGRSYALSAWRQPLFPLRWYWPLQRASLRPHIFAWLRGVAEATAVAPENVDDAFLDPLMRLQESGEVSEVLRDDARHAVARLKDGAWKPRHALSHKDFWQGNILLDSPKPSVCLFPKRFFVIDWAGALIKGYPMGDLVRASKAFKLSDARLAAEIDEHCRILQCSREDAKGYLLAGTGYLSTRLEHFPRGLFFKCSEESFFKMRRALEA